MRILILILFVSVCNSCISIQGTRGFYGKIVYTYSIEADQSVKLQVDEKGLYNFTFVNKSEAGQSLIIKPINSQSITLLKGDSAKFELRELDGVEIKNLSKQRGDMFLEIYIKGKAIEVPTAVIIK